MAASYNWWEFPRRFIREFHEYEAYYEGGEVFERMGEDRGQR